MWLGVGMTGRPAAPRRRFSRAARSWWRARSDWLALRCRTLARAPGRHHGGKRGGEDEARREAPDGVDDDGRRGDVPADDAEGLREGPLDHGQPIEHPVALGDAGTPRAVEPHRMDLVEVGEGVVPRRHVAQLSERRNVPVHGVHRLEADEGRTARADGGQMPLEIGRVVVAEDPLLRAAPADALDHRGVVLLVRQDHAAGQEAGQHADGGLVRGVAGREQERRGLLVQVRQLALEEHVGMRGAGDVAGPARPGADALEGLGHGLQHEGMLAHAEVVVGAPDRHLDRALGPVPGGARKVPAVALEIGEDPVAALRAESGEGVAQGLLVPDGRGRGVLWHVTIIREP